MTNITRSPQKRSPLVPKEIYTYTVVLQSKALDHEGVPEDTRTVTIYLREYPFPREIEQAVSFWLDCGYEIVDKWMTLHQRFDAAKNIFIDIWNPPLEM